MRHARSPRTRRRFMAITTAIAALAVMASTPPASATRQRAGAVSMAKSPTAQDRYAKATQRAHDLVKRLTLDEKIAMVHGAGFQSNAGFAGLVAGVPRLGIPALYWRTSNGVGNGATGVTPFPAGSTRGDLGHRAVRATAGHGAEQAARATTSRWRRR